MAFWAFLAFHFGLLRFDFLTFWAVWAATWGPPHKLPKMARFLNVPHKEFNSARSGYIFQFLALWASFPCILAFWALISFHFGLLGLHFLHFGLLGLHFFSVWPFGPSFPFILALGPSFSFILAFWP